MRSWRQLCGQVRSYERVMSEAKKGAGTTVCLPPESYLICGVGQRPWPQVQPPPQPPPVLWTLGLKMVKPERMVSST